MSDNKTPDLRQELSSGPQEQNIPEEHSKKADINYMNAMQSMFRAMNQVPGAMPQEEHTTQEEPTQAYSAPQAKPPVPEAVAPQVSAEQPVQPTPAAQAPFAQAPAAGTPTAQAPFAQAPAASTPTAQAPFAQAPAADTPTAQAPFAQAPAAGTPTAQAPFAQAPYAQAPVAGTPAAQAPFAQGGYFTGKAEPVADTAPFHTLSSEQAERASAQPATPSAVPEPSAEEFAGDREDESYWSYVDSILDHFDEEKKGQATGRPKSETFPRQQSAARTAVAPQPAPETPSAPANPDWAQAGTPAERAYAARQTRIHQSREAYERQNPVSRQPSSAVGQPMQSAWQDQAATQQTVEFPPQQPQEDAFLSEKEEKKKKPVKKKPVKKKAEDVQPSGKGKKAKKGKKGKKKKGGNILPKKGDSAFEIVRKLVVIISAIALLGCAIYFGYTFKERYDNRNVNKDAQALANQDYSDEEVAAKWKEIKAKYPDVDFPEGMQVKFASLYAQNQDLVGWIKIEGLGINYPVMQNGDYYLKHNFSKAYSAYGAPYLDQYNKVNPLDDNTTIYAHSMRRDDQMFTNLKEYKTVDGFKKNPIIEYSTLYGNYKFKVYAVFITNGDASGDNGYLFNYPTSNFVSDEAFVGYLEQLNQRALYTTGVDVEIGDKLITLSTCTYDFTDARLVVVGRMVRKGEDAVVDTSQAVKNSNPRYPQAYYSAKGLSNPYKNAKKWYNQDA